ncbi:MAG: HAD family phosphatase [Acidimicrobiia bacterium]|nr:HAD family phosphatase [Acidimicrobiia bacterium]
MITTAIFDYGGVISSPLFRGIGEFEASEGFRKGSLITLLFGEVHYVGVEGRAVASEIADELDADPDTLEAEGEAVDVPDWHLLERGEIGFAQYLDSMIAKAPHFLGRPLDLEAYGRFMTTSAPGVHWMVVHRIRELRDSGLRLGLLTNNVKEFGDHWRSSFPVEELFEVVVDSSHVGMRKPEREIYELTCDRLGIHPAEAVFVDDNADNIAAAELLGMSTVHFGEDPWAALAALDEILSRR